MGEPLWQLLLKDSSDFSCRECFAVKEFYAGLLAEGGPNIFPCLLQHLRRCPLCSAEHHRALERLGAALVILQPRMDMVTRRWSER